MNINVRKVAILAMWAVSIFAFLQAISWISSQKVEVAYTPDDLTNEQIGVRVSIIGNYEALLPIPVATEYSDASVREIPQPDWYQKGQIVLTTSDEQQIARAKLVPAPPIIFGTDRGSVYELNSAIGFIVEWMFLSALITIILLLFGTPGMMFGIVIGLILTIINPLLGLPILMTVSLSAGLAYLTKKYWPHPTSAEQSIAER
jgi:hypothetical protein